MIRRALAALWPLYRLAALSWWRWALREIDPMHPDVRQIVLRIHELERRA